MALTQKQIDNRGKKRDALKAQMDELQKQIDEIDNEMKAECEQLGVEELRGENYIVRWARQIRNQFQSAKFKADHADLYAQYQKAEERRPFTFGEMTEKDKAAVKAAKTATTAAPVPLARATA